jgi:uncharacterized RDD family membrane protein YckC
MIGAGMTQIATYGDTASVGFGPRLLAGLTDLAILVPLHVATWALVVSLDASGPTFIIPAILNYAYFSLFWTKAGATPGKMVMRLKVVDAATGGAIDRGTAWRRWLGMWCGLLALGYGYARIASRDDHEALHDRWARTKVVSSR